MRTPRRVKQQMFLASYHNGSPLYEKDSNGNIIYDTMSDGTQIPRQIGEIPPGYDEPVEFYNSITSDLSAEELQAFGTEPHTKAKMTYRKGDLDISVSDLIWKDNEIVYVDGVVDEKSADFRVVGIQKGRNFYKALLVKLV